MAPLKLASLLSWCALSLSQLGLLWPGLGVPVYFSLPLVVVLMIPLRGLLLDRLYTYRWLGFLTLVYFCIGISEGVANPGLRVYAFATTISSAMLFLSTIYRARDLGRRPPG